MASNGLLAIGLDAGDLTFIESRLQYLPNLAALIERSEIYRPDSPQSLSGSVWPTFYTASDPGAHGIYQHLLWDPIRMGLKRIGPDWCRREPFWKKLDDEHIRTIVVDVPYCFPSELKHGVEILDWGTHGQTRPCSANTSEVRAFLKRFGRSPIGREAPIPKSQTELNRIRRVLLESVERKSDLMLELMDRYDWDLCLPIFAEIHRGGHIFYSDNDEPGSNTVDSPLLDVYKAIDNGLGRLMAAAEQKGATVMLFSVHGMMRDNNQSGLVTRVMEIINERFMEEHFGLKPTRKHRDISKQRTREGLIGKLRDFVPDNIQLMAAKASPDFFRAWVVEQEIVGGLDWSRTPGFALRTDIRSEIRLNMKGREKKGMLEPGSQLCDAYIKWMTDVFMSLEDADRDHKLVEEVVSIHESLPGKHAQMLPDFAVKWRRVPLASHIRSSLIGDVYIEPFGIRGGDHRDEGFVVLDNKANAGPITPPEKVSEIPNLISDFVLAQTKSRESQV